MVDKLMRKYAALLDTEWEVSLDSKEVIRGRWAEDGSSFLITCPPQLRDLLVELQNCLHDKYHEIENQQRELAASIKEVKWIT